MSPARWIAPLLLACVAFAGPASACSITHYVDAFQPKPIADRAQWWALMGIELPTVEASVYSVERTHSFWACDYEAEVDLVLRWSPPAGLSWNDVGVYIVPVGVSGATDIPLRPRERHGEAHLTIQVGDSQPDAEVDREYEVRLVDNAMRFGPVTRLRVHLPARPVEPFLSSLRIADALNERDGKARCSEFSPLGCGGPVELMVLAHGEVMRSNVRPWEVERADVTCVGVRQFSGRTSRMVFHRDVLGMHVLAAEWAVDAPDWPHLARGCGAMMATITALETAAAAEAQARRPKPGRK